MRISAKKPCLCFAVGYLIFIFQLLHYYLLKFQSFFAIRLSADKSSLQFLKHEQFFEVNFEKLFRNLNTFLSILFLFLPPSLWCNFLCKKKKKYVYQIRVLLFSILLTFIHVSIFCSLLRNASSYKKINCVLRINANYYHLLVWATTSYYTYLTHLRH